MNENFITFYFPLNHNSHLKQTVQLAASFWNVNTIRFEKRKSLISRSHISFKEMSRFLSWRLQSISEISLILSADLGEIGFDRCALKPMKKKKEGTSE